MARSKWHYVTPDQWAALLGLEPGRVRAGRARGLAYVRIRLERKAAGRELARVAAELRAARYRLARRVGAAWWQASVCRERAGLRPGLAPGLRARLARPDTVWRLLLARMVPGVWYGVRELRALVPWVAVRTVRLYTVQHARAYLERAHNPAWAGTVKVGAYCEPRFLVRLNPEGERLRVETLEALATLEAAAQEKTGDLSSPVYRVFT